MKYDDEVIVRNSKITKADNCRELDLFKCDHSKIPTNALDDPMRDDICAPKLANSGDFSTDRGYYCKGDKSENCIG